MIRCIFINIRKRWVLFFLLSTLADLIFVSATVEECSYEGDICDIDYQKCLVKGDTFRMVEGGPCSSIDILYGPGVTLFNTRGEVPFYIIFNKNREKYATPMTYRILHYSIKNNEYTSIDDCCSVPENETCILPTMDPGDEQYVFVPFSIGSDRYCYYDIFEVQGTLEWCDEIPETNLLCKTFENGELKIENSYTTLSTARVHTEYCFFEAPSEYIKENRSDTSKMYTTKVVGITFGENVGEVRIGNATHPCEVTENVEHFARHKRSASKAACIFTKSNIDNKWDKTPLCTIPTLKDTEPQLDSKTIWITIVIVVAIAVILIIIVAVSFWVYKKHIKICFPDYEKTIKELPNADVLDDIEEQNFIRNNNTKIVDNEAPDLIVTIESSKLQIEKQEDCVHKNIDAIKNNETDAEGIPSDDCNQKLTECNSDFDEEIENVTMEYVRKQNCDEVEDLYENNEAPRRINSDLDSGFSHNTFESCDIFETEHKPSFVKKSENSDESSLPTDTGKISDLKSISTLDTSSIDGDDTMTYPHSELITNVADTNLDGYTAKNDVMTIDFFPKKVRVSESSSGRGSLDEEVLLRPRFKSIEHPDKGRVIHTRINSFLPSHDSKMPVITDGYMPK